MKRPILISSLILLFTMGLATADTIHVPGAYPYIDIQQAVDIAKNGDTIVIAPGTHYSDGLTINKNIIITGAHPQNPESVVIEFVEHHPCWGFILRGDVVGTCTLNGLTVYGVLCGAHDASDGIDPGDDGFDGYSHRYQGSIIIRGNHVVSNCIVRDGWLQGGLAGDGADGDANGYPGDPCDPPVPINYGGNGGRGGSTRGVGINIDWGHPQIINTIVENCVAIGHNGGAGGAGLDAIADDQNVPGGDGGDGGSGGDAIGAGVYCGIGTRPIFRDCIFRNNQAYAGDANDGADGGEGVVEETNYHTGGDGGHGGVPGVAKGAGVYCDSGVNATFINCQFIGNRAYSGIAGDGGDAGDIHPSLAENLGGFGGLVAAAFSVPDSPQGGNPPQNFSAYGGGCYIEHGATATFTGCTFRDNVTRGSVSGQGGWPSRSYHEVPRRNFPIPSYGAGVYCNDWTTTTFTDCNVQDNWTTQEPNQYPGDLYPYGIHPTPDFDYGEAEYTAYGGGMCFVGGTLGSGNFGYVELNHCNISDNNAPVGGGVFASALTDFHVDECNFVGNSSYLGGGLFSIDNYSTISRSTFIGNRAYEPNEDLRGCGGGLFSFSTDVIILDCIFSENTTNGFGAGMYMAGEVAIPPLTTEPALKNCLLSNNKAGIDGGGIYCDWYTKPNIINCTITGNEAKGDPPFYLGYGGGLYCSYESDVNIINSIVWDNAGPNTIGPELAVETWPYFGPTTLTVSYCDVEGGIEEVWVDDDSTLNWGAGNIHEDPLFVNGYYLSQIWAGQMADSPCVDAGSEWADALGLHYYTTRTDGVPDAYYVDMGYHYPITIEASCDFDGDDDVDLVDFEIFVSYWLEQYCHFLGWCEGADLDRDKDVDFVDYATFAQAYSPPKEPLPPDNNAPEPNPSKWEIEPHPLSSSAIHMMAVTAYDPSGGVQYQFQCVSGGGHSSDWQDSPEYTDTGLAALTEYTYSVRTRDVHLNIGYYSEPRSATTLP